ncbi:MAG: hypothetical protein ACE5FO_04615 [Parvularculaceae bacterium]
MFTSIVHISMMTYLSRYECCRLRLACAATVLDSPSKAESDQGLEGQVWREELIEEAFYLLGEAAGEDLAQGVEAKHQALRAS